jgi:RNA polymerase sigma factor (sigma-70 family)
MTVSRQRLPDGTASQNHLRPDLSGPSSTEDFTTLFHTHAAELHRYLSRWAPTAADDLVADVFVSAIRSRTAYDPAQATARVWLYGIATNLLHTHLRSLRREQTAHARLAVTHSTAGVDGHENRVLERIDAQARARQFAVALRDLEDRDRDVLLLTGWAGLDSTEVAAALEIPVGTVRSRLHRVRRQLRAACPQIELEEDRG